MKKDVYTIHDDRYQFYQALAQDKGFIKEITAYKLRLSMLNHPIPIGGFRNSEDMDAWIDKVHKDHHRRIRSDPKYIKEEHKITGGRGRVSLQIGDEVEALRQKLLPPYPYFAPLLEIVDRYIHGRDRDFDDFTFITEYVLKEKIVYNALWLASKFVSDGKGGKELWIRIYPNTRKEQVMRHWQKIKKMQKELAGYRDRNRGLKTDEEDADNRSEASFRTAQSRRGKILKNVTDKELP